jgi:hypothetical protein
MELPLDKIAIGGEPLSELAAGAGAGEDRSLHRNDRSLQK